MNFLPAATLHFFDHIQEVLDFRRTKLAEERILETGVLGDLWSEPVRGAVGVGCLQVGKFHFSHYETLVGAGKEIKLYGKSGGTGYLPAVFFYDDPVSFFQKMEVGFLADGKFIFLPGQKTL